MALSLLKDVAVNLPALVRGRTPGQLIIQTTDYCNATCPQCGMRKQEKFQRSRLDVDSMKRIIDRGGAKNRVKALSFTGGANRFCFRTICLIASGMHIKKTYPISEPEQTDICFRMQINPGS